MKRLKLRDRKLPDYTTAEEIMNMVTHIVGGGLGILFAVLAILHAARTGDPLSIIGCALYGTAIITLYTISSVYHGLRPGTGKKVLQILDHCAIYVLISGTYTPILLISFLPACPDIALGLMVLQWGLAAMAITLTAIDLHRFRVISMVCYIFMGWSIVFFLPQTMGLLGSAGFFWLLAGGIAYTIGAVLYGIGVKCRWMHSVFHIFVVLGSSLQFISIFFYVLP